MKIRLLHPVPLRRREEGRETGQRGMASATSFARGRRRRALASGDASDGRRRAASPRREAIRPPRDRSSSSSSSKPSLLLGRREEKISLRGRAAVAFARRATHQIADPQRGPARLLRAAVLRHLARGSARARERRARLARDGTRPRRRFAGWLEHVYPRATRDRSLRFDDRSRRAGALRSPARRRDALRSTIRREWDDDTTRTRDACLARARPACGYAARGHRSSCFETIFEARTTRAR